MTNNPFENKVWIKNCIATGAITPPAREVERINKITMYAVFFVVAIGSLISWMAFAWR